MNTPILFATATVPLSKSASQLPLGRNLFLIALALACFCVSPGSQAVSPAPDGGYPNANTAEGDFALYSLTTGFENTAIGYLSLFSVTNGGFNTAVGYEALYHNMAGNNIAVGYLSLFYNTTGGQNIAVGGLALYPTLLVAITPASVGEHLKGWAILARPVVRKTPPLAPTHYNTT